MTVNYKTLGKTIKKLRNERELSQYALADMTDLSPQYICQIETAKKKASLQSIVKISSSLNVSVDELLSGNINNDIPIFENLLLNTTTYEKKVLYETVRILKEILQQNKHLI
jgi:transcriptional regulator with XRE-family HTH domain